jgi:hypothetical protein
MKLTYREAYDRIVDAYFKDQLNPFQSCACFIGNLLGSQIWSACRGNPKLKQESDKVEGLLLINSFGYSIYQIELMEDNFLNEIFFAIKGYRYASPRNEGYASGQLMGEKYENALFAAMSSTLDILKKIHEENGEVVDAPVFIKRELAKV